MKDDIHCIIVQWISCYKHNGGETHLAKRKKIMSNKTPVRQEAPRQAGTQMQERKLSAVSASTDQYSCEYGSAKFYALCGFGGILSCSLTHTAVVPIDLIKCRIQVEPTKYKNLINGFRLTAREEGVRTLARGWAPTFIGYSMQGLCKFGLYEVFKMFYSEALGEEKAYQYRTSLYLASSLSAEFFADIALCPMESVKVRVQTAPASEGWGTTLRECTPRLWQREGIYGFYKGLPPLWMRQIPYTMMKFAAFERTVEFLYKHVVPVPRDQLGKPSQLVVTFAAGYIAGILCTLISHPFDSVVSKLNSQAGSSMWDATKQLGMAGLWRGLSPRILMVGTITALQWFIYDSVKILFRLPRPPPPEMPESLKRKLQVQ